MRKIITFFIFCFLFGKCFSQAGEWVWLKGDSVPNQAANYGVQGVPGPSNQPPGIYEPCEWRDINGNFWVYIYADLWRYNPLTNEWTWMKGPGTISYPGSYGIKGVPSPSNNPPALSTGITSWTDNQGNFWMFGGQGVGGPFNALWKYDVSTNEWTWMKGSNSGGQWGVYGTQGIPNTLNVPGCRWECVAAWTDDNGSLWLFGGWSANLFNDLWKYDISTNEWTWMKGSDIPNQPAVYGTLGIEDPANTPGCRMSYSRWKDSNGNLWLFGGFLYASTPYNDLWRYNVTSNKWAWMGGSNTGVAPENYGVKCVSSVSNIPGARYECRSTWNDQKGNFWLFGGGTYAAGTVWNDLWKYCTVTHEWTWISGDTIVNPTGHWGTQGVYSPANKPNGRFGSVGMTDNNGYIYLFGGVTYTGFGYSYNDLWKYAIDTTCGVCPNTTSIAENNPPKADELLIFPNPTNSSLTISFSSSEKQNIELRLYNTLGEVQLFQSFKTLEKLFQKEINVEKMSGGIYFLQLKTNDGNINRKIIISH
ncbi:MAG TPA: kelch repeat-containing protein [Bacteroidia bacterium]|nr:kelch repeat-containing protein [Bacteroidia bacterium]